MYCKHFSLSLQMNADDVICQILKSMNEITEILSKSSISEIIASLREKSVDVPQWSSLVGLYEPSQHTIAQDRIGRKDRKRSDGVVEKATRLYVGLEKLLTKRMTSFTFALPVKRVYHNLEEDETRKRIAKAIELIYKHARIDSENIERATKYYASCEIFTMWYAVKKPNTLYGFKSDYKLKCKTYSPMEGVKLYPLFNELDDLLAISFEYEKTVKEKKITFFETFTADKHYIWKCNAGDWEQVQNPEEIVLGKIPGIYAWRNLPIYAGLSHIREEIEYTLSRNSDVIAYNAAPILKVVGEIDGVESKGDSRRVYRVQNGGDVGYVSWSQANDAVKYHISTLLDLFFMQAQIPDISFENMKSLGNIGYDARMTLFTDAHLKVGEESGAWLEFLERECNVIKAFLGKMNAEFASELDNVEVEHIITPFVQNDLKNDITNAMSACGGKPIMSQIDAIRMAGLTSDADNTLKQIQDEEAKSAAARMESIMSGAM